VWLAIRYAVGVLELRAGDAVEPSIGEDMAEADRLWEPAAA
jgi:hypothetical protein